MYIMYMCLKKYIYMQRTRSSSKNTKIVVKTLKCSDLLPSGSKIIDLDFLNNLLSSNFFFTINHILYYLCVLKILHLLCHMVNILLKIS